MAKRKTESVTATLTTALADNQEDQQVLDNLAGVEFEEEDNVLDSTVKVGKKEEKNLSLGTPQMTDVGWTDYVLSLLSEKEKHNEHPRVAGLRRLVPILLGEIMTNRADPVQAPNPDNGHTATVQATLIILWDRDGTTRTFTGLADVFRGEEGKYAGNTEPKFARFPSSVAESRAEGRALRKALMIDVVTAEELTDLPVEVIQDGLCDLTQQNFIDLKCSQLNIDVMKFVNKGLREEEQYSSLQDLSRKSADAIMARLNDYQTNKCPIPEKIRGYQKDWKTR